ncbi:unnamed protein product [Arabis nemorensis]|uniref:Uncharacterized protein n=1 Tax=Arabis nemorensis TaxID=586526 RepID=A0A565BEC7_9BRAS|nr:unnamed protein product [Arabis nemorensis]VVB00045.1 unnamed protein product [Arabis nemorensis]
MSSSSRQLLSSPRQLPSSSSKQLPELLNTSLRQLPSSPSQLPSSSSRQLPSSSSR